MLVTTRQREVTLNDDRDLILFLGNERLQEVEVCDFPWGED